MDVFDFAEIDCARERGPGISLNRDPLLVDECRPPAFDRAGSWVLPSSESDDQERKLRITELRPPVCHPRRESVIVARFSDVRLALVPGDAFDPQRAKRSDHCIVDRGDS